MAISSEALRQELTTSAERDTLSEQKVAERAGSTLRPPGALARFDRLAVWVAGWHKTPEPVVGRPAIIVFAGEHGVVAEGISSFGSEVNAEMMNAFHLDRASISAIGRAVGAKVFAVDVGVGQPTGNIRIEPALDSDRLAEAFMAGRQSVRERQADLLVFGEMGIGNTTSAAALSAALTLAPEDRTHENIAPFVGTGAGLDETQHKNKVDVVVDAVERVGNLTDPIQLLAELGGTELAAICGAMLEARVKGIPVLLDGYIATAPALVLHAIDPNLIAHTQAGHRSAEPGHANVLETIEREPLLDLDMRLGEGTGAAAAIPLVAMACRLVTEVPTFEEWFSSDSSGRDL